MVINLHDTSQLLISLLLFFIIWKEISLNCYFLFNIKKSVSTPNQEQQYRSVYLLNESENIMDSQKSSFLLGGHYEQLKSVFTGRQTSSPTQGHTCQMLLE